MSAMAVEKGKEATFIGKTGGKSRRKVGQKIDTGDKRNKKGRLERVKIGEKRSTRCRRSNGGKKGTKNVATKDSRQKREAKRRKKTRGGQRSQSQGRTNLERRKLHSHHPAVLERETVQAVPSRIGMRFHGAQLPRLVRVVCPPNRHG